MANGAQGTSRMCSVEGCGKEHRARGYCDLHYQRWNRHGDPVAGGPAQPRLDTPLTFADPSSRRKGICAIEGCVIRSAARGLCPRHYARWRRHGDPRAPMRETIPVRGELCSIEGCDDRRKARGWCERHYQRWRAYGDPTGGHRAKRRPLAGVDLPHPTEADAYRWRKYRLTPDEYQAIVEAQNGLCAICRREELVVDHSERSGNIRGLLCNNCNSGNGLFDHDPNRLRAAADYLERNR